MTSPAIPTALQTAESFPQCCTNHHTASRRHLQVNTTAPQQERDSPGFNFEFCCVSRFSYLSRNIKHVFNPLTTIYSCHPNLVACYLLVQPVLKVGSTLQQKGWDEGRQAGATLQVTAQRAWSAPGHFSSCTNGRRKHSFHLVRAPFLAFQSAGTFPGQRVLTIECLLMSGCGQGHKLVTTI